MDKLTRSGVGLILYNMLYLCILELSSKERKNSYMFFGLAYSLKDDVFGPA